MAFLFKNSGLYKKAFKLYPSISYKNEFRNFCFRKFYVKDNADGKFQQLASAFGYGLGIALYFGFSNFHASGIHKANVIPGISTYSFCDSEEHSSVPPEKEYGSPRNNFNFIADVVEKTQNSVVYIEIKASHPYTGEFISVSNGSGFIINENGLILTNAHVVDHYGQVTVKLYDGKTYNGFVEDLDTDSDLATVRIKANNLPALPLGCSSNIRPGEFVIAMGNPLTLSHTITAGVVSSVHRKGIELGLHKKSDYIQTDATIHIGNSGGPLVNLDGEAIGINTMKVTEGISFAIPSDRAIEFLKRIEKSKSGGWSFFKRSSLPSKHKFLGLTLFTLSSAVIHELKANNSDFPSIHHGVIVWRVMFNSPAYKAGVRPGDVITEVNGKEVLSAGNIVDLLEDEDTLQLIVHRGQNIMKITVSLVTLS